MTSEFISAYLINQKQLEELIMNALRTNETKRVGDLISSALLNAIDQNYTPPKSKNTFKIKVEEVDPVRSAERVPFTSSHQLFAPSFDSPSTTLRTGAQDDAANSSKVAAA